VPPPTAPLVTDLMELSIFMMGFLGPLLYGSLTAGRPGTLGEIDKKFEISAAGARLTS
jgi:hypothetical protein